MARLTLRIRILIIAVVIAAASALALGPSIAHAGDAPGGGHTPGVVSTPVQ